MLALVFVDLTAFVEKAVCANFCSARVHLFTELVNC